MSSGTLNSLLPIADLGGAVTELSAEGGDAFASSGIRPFVLAALIAEQPANSTLVVAGDDRSARELRDDIAEWLAPRRVLVYPTRGVDSGSHLAPPPHLVGLRLAALEALLGGEGTHGAPVVVASAVALAERVPESALRPASIRLVKAEPLNLEATLAALVEAGYERVDQVAARGQFAVRGGILDLYPTTSEHALRVDLFGDEIESMRWFSTFTQRSLGDVDVVEVAPAAELAAEHRELAEIAALEDLEDRPPLDELLPLERYCSPLDLAGDVVVTVAAAEEIAPALADWWEDILALHGSDDADALHIPPDQLLASIDEKVGVRLSALDSGQAIAVRGGSPDAAARSMKEAEPELEKLIRNGYRAVITFPREGDADRAAWNLLRVTAGKLADGVPDEGAVSFAVANLREGFVAPELKLAVIPADRLVRRRARRKTPRHGRAVLASFSDLNTGDVIVHEDHGVARFTGFDTKAVAGVTRDYLELEYAGGDRVFLPVDQLAKISRYLGARDEDPQLSKLGGTAWERAKGKAKAAAELLAGELLSLYAERRRRSGHAFPPDGEMQRDFEHAFPHRETGDQLEAIESVKVDMESPQPMDRLICGDVGYGKTEVALRAAFKCATEGKQVLMLVPTTILAQQHFGTFSERFNDYPLLVDLISRFRSKEQQAEVIKSFNEGKVDVLVGTHRLLGRDLKPKDLGLIIVDEEQRFGVRQKESLRQLRLRTDVMAMSATPIPRTLQMSLAGVRDISVIETPPEGRRPVKTFVGEFDESLVVTAIERELDRGGRAFYLHNRVETIDEAASRLTALVPSAKVTVIHGGLDESELEERMFGFIRGESDVLVCTSIIEAGIDIPEANTLIVERADMLGLSQLYQIRGRVGRGRDRAHAYLFYPAAAALTPDASKRLAALSDHTELGSGFRIAMRDLEIRGAGNLLGSEQSGHVAALGFELYLRMLDEAVAELEGEDETEVEPVRLDIPVDAYVPGDYVDYERGKIDIHRRVASANEVSALEEIKHELVDRFGPLPEPLERLFELQRVRIRFGEAGIREVVFRGGKLTVGPIDLDSSGLKDLRERCEGAMYESGRHSASLRCGDDPGERLAAALGLADALAATAAAAAA